MNRQQTFIAIAGLATLTAAGVTLFLTSVPTGPRSTPDVEASGSGTPTASAPHQPVDEPAPVPAQPSAPSDPGQLSRFDQALELEWQQRAAAGRPTGADEFVEQWRAASMAVWATAPPADRPRAFARASEALAIPYFNEFGIDAYSALGVVLTEEFVNAVDATLAGCRDQAGAPIWPCVIDARQPAPAQLISLAGDFVAFGITTGLISQDGHLTVSTSVLRVIFLYRWFGLIAASVPLEQALLPTEYRTFLRWRIEAAHGVTDDRRIDLEMEFAAMFGDSDGGQ